MATLTFLGAAQTVTGSKYLLNVAGHRMLVDCGMFQGLKALRQKNWDPFPIEPASLECVVLTHAHLDHCGYLPRLVASGFKGRIFCTPGTRDLCHLVLNDAAKLQEEDARQANRHGYSRHHPAEPLFTTHDAARTLELLQPVGYDRPVPVMRGVEATFRNAGHLLGSSWVPIRLDGDHAQTIVFGGDLGRYGRPVLPDPDPCREADVLLVESTYGNRRHAPDDHGAELAALVTSTADRGGKLIIPSFAIGRVEEVLYWVKRLEDERRIPALPVYVDSPMALDALGYYARRANELDPDMVTARRGATPFATKKFRPVETTEGSKEVMRSKEPCIIVSSSGMATGGRVLHHLEHCLPDPKHTVLFVGFQSPGTRGRSLLDGASQVKIHGRLIPVEARIAKIDSMSAHADQAEILQWLSMFTTPPKRTFLVHGEPDAMTTLRTAIEQQLGWSTAMPALGESADLSLL